MRETKDRNQSRRRGEKFRGSFRSERERDVLFAASMDGRADRWTDVTHLPSRTYSRAGKILLVRSRLGEKKTTMAMAEEE